MKRLIQIVVLLFFALAGSSRAGDETLPAIDTVLKHIRTMANQEQGNDRLFRSRYAFVQTVTNRELDSKGRIKNCLRTASKIVSSTKPPGVCGSMKGIGCWRRSIST